MPQKQPGNAGFAAQRAAARAAERRELGARGEELACTYLEEQGYRVLARNWRCRQGELDIVAATPREIVAVEVKTRRHTDTGHPLEAVTARKRQTLRRLLRLWLKAHDMHAPRIRIDAIGVVMSGSLSPTITHVRAV